VTLKSSLGVIVGHWKWHLFIFHCKHGCILYCFRNRAR